jgi:hypothetical protein
VPLRYVIALLLREERARPIRLSLLRASRFGSPADS